MISHAVAGVGAILLFVAPFIGRTRHAPSSIRLPLILVGLVGIAWSLIGIYLYSHGRDASHTQLATRSDLLSGNHSRPGVNYPDDVTGDRNPAGAALLIGNLGTDRLRCRSFS